MSESGAAELSYQEQVHQLLRLVVDKGASDLHLKVPSPPVLRIDGALVVQEYLAPLTADDIEAIFQEITTQEQRIAFVKEMELDFAYSLPGLARFRVNVLQQRGTIGIAFRFVPFTLPTIDELGLPRILEELVMKPRGLILVTGPTGSGKSTTLAAMLNHLNENDSRSVVTVEDPVEFLHPDKKCIIVQRDLGDDTRTFSAALTHALRHDIDVIVIGELRDLATISTAIRAAETGHLVIGTLHTNDAAQSIDRIIDVFPPEQQGQIRLQLAQVIEAVVSQVLLRRREGGRVAAFEIMLATGVIRRLIREEKIHEIPPNIDLGKLEGMQTLDRALADLVRDNVVAAEEALAKSSNPARLANMLRTDQGGHAGF
ncbi:MAG: type IV pilus twitching motility protein PilT [Dehalococcoidales bacterium]|nr:type IV pilus twitching motility protein PilT [Dehalococcoidales bacterium]